MRSGYCLSVFVVAAFRTLQFESTSPGPLLVATQVDTWNIAHGIIKGQRLDAFISTMQLRASTGGVVPVTDARCKVQDLISSARVGAGFCTQSSLVTILQVNIYPPAPLML
jgi:hypothetical protein